MSVEHIKPGINIPNDIYVIIEISYHSHPIKYETDKKTHALFVDRFIPTSMLYPCNYGYINQTLSEDGDPLDVLIPIPYKLHYHSIIQCKPIGILKMLDESGEDEKIIAFPHDKICNEYKKINNVSDISDILKQKIIHFFQHYKDLEKNKWVKILELEDVESAKNTIIKAHQKFKKKHHI